MKKQQTQLKAGMRVTISGGMEEFRGKRGVIINTERLIGDVGGLMYRVRLDEPVEIPGLGKVEDDVWAVDRLQPLKEETTAAVRRY